MKNKFAKIAMVLASVMLLTACGNVNGGGKTAEKKTDPTAYEKFLEEYPSKVEHEGDTVNVDTLKVAVATDTPFKGILNGFLYVDGIDRVMIENAMNGALPVDGNFKYILDSDETPIKVSIDTEKNTVTYKINPNFKWSNGEQVTTADIVKTYEIVANQEYIDAAQSVRYDDDMQNIEGIEAYNKGEADKISGLEVIDDSNMVIHLKEIGPSALFGAGFAGEFVNAKQMEGIAMKDIIESDALRKNPLSYGPYVVKEVVPGEEILFEANPHYYRGEPKIKNVRVQILPTAQQVAAIKSGQFDLVYDATQDIFPEIKDLDNISIASKLELYMTYFGFKLGTFEEGEVKTNPDAKMADVKLRQAMAHAVDNVTIGEKFYHGLRFPAPTAIAPMFKDLHNPEQLAYSYDLELANKLLDEAGFKDVDNDGIREDKNGEKLTINFAMMSGSEVQEPLSQYYIQQWKQIGLDVQLVDGRLLEFQNFYERIQKDDPAIDMWAAAWGLGSDPNPNGLYGKATPFNFPRYITPELEDILAKLVSREALDPEKQVEFYHAFEKIAMEDIPMVPQLNRVAILPINKRVKVVDYSYDTEWGWHLLEVTAPEPIAASN